MHLNICTYTHIGTVNRSAVGGFSYLDVHHLFHEFVVQCGLGALEFSLGCHTQHVDSGFHEAGQYTRANLSLEQALRLGIEIVHLFFHCRQRFCVHKRCIRFCVQKKKNDATMHVRMCAALGRDTKQGREAGGGGRGWCRVRECCQGDGKMSLMLMPRKRGEG